MTEPATEQGRMQGPLARLRQLYRTHRDFFLLLGLFSVLQVMLLAIFAPGGHFGDYSDYWYYEEMASRLDSGYLPYIHYWVEYPPLFPWIPVGAYWLSRLLPPAPQPHLWFYVTFGGIMGLFAAGNLIMVYLLGILLYDRPRALRCAWFYALLFGTLFVHAGWFDGVSLFFMLLSLYLLFRNRAVLSGVFTGVGAMVKVLPLVLVPVGFKLLPRRWRYLVSLGLVLVAVNLPFYLANPALFAASWRALLTQPSWETVWALLDGYYSYGLVLGNRFDPAEAGIGLRPEVVPWPVVLVVFGLVYLFVYVLPWQQNPEGRPRAGGRGWLSRVLDQFRNPIMGQGEGAVNRVSVVAFVGLSLNLFLLSSKGYSPQFVLWYLPFLVLVLPNGWGLAYATLLTLDSVAERILYFLVLPDSHWLLAGTVLFRTLLMLVLVPEYLAAMGFLSLPRWRRLTRWGLLLTALVGVVALALGTAAFVRDYSEQRYLNSPDRAVVDRIQAAGQPGDGVIVTSRRSFDAVAPFLKDQEVRLHTRDDGEFRPQVFEAQWAGFLERNPRIWLLLDYAGGQNADWNALLDQRLGRTGYKAVDEWVGPEQRLAYYDVREPAAVRVEDLNALFGDEIGLTSADLAREPMQAGEVLPLELRGQALGQILAERKLFVHLVSDGDQLRAQTDVSLLDLDWNEEGDAWVKRIGLLLPPDLEPGSYRLRVGVYDPATGERLPLPSGHDSIEIEEIQVE